MLCLRRWRAALLVALLCARATSARASLAYGSVDAAGLDAMTTKFGGDGVTVWDGRVIFAPLTSAAVGVFDPATNAFTLVPAGGDAQFKGGALANDGRVVFAPAADHSFVGVFDPETDTFTKFIAEGPGGLIEFGATHPFKGRRAPRRRARRVRAGAGHVRGRVRPRDGFIREARSAGVAGWRHD
jgi:hypothetical protein